MVASPDDFKPGSQLGAYTILKLLGQGGMARVYLAEHSTIGRLVALKVLRPEYRGNADAVHRFFLEARAVNKIHDPHIVEVTDFCTEQGVEAHYVMQFLEGKNIHALLAKNGISLLRGLEIARQAASALAAVHDAGIVHRDFTANNVFVTTDSDGNDWVKILDFGLAKLDDAHGRLIGDTLDGIAAGTPEYMSPEQVSGKTVDERSDIYSFGVVLYQIVTGQLPFVGKDAMDTAAMHLKRRPKHPTRVKGLRWRIPRDLANLVMRCLAKNPEQRPASMREVQPELAIIADLVRFAAARRSRSLQRAWAVAAAVMILFAGSAFTDLLHHRSFGASIRMLVARAAPSSLPTPLVQSATLEALPAPQPPPNFPTLPDDKSAPPKTPKPRDSTPDLFDSSFH